jgi:hypothetical protein
VHSEAVPEGIVYEEIEISGYLEDVKAYTDDVFVEENIEVDAKKV